MMKTLPHDNSALNAAVENNPNKNEGGETVPRWSDYCKRPKDTRDMQNRWPQHATFLSH